jgi:TrfA protein
MKPNAIELGLRIAARRASVDTANGLDIDRRFASTRSTPYQPSLFLAGCNVDVLAAPNSLLRCALFSVFKKGERGPAVRDKKVISLSNIELIFSGERLDQRDLDLYLILIDLARITHLGDEVNVNNNQLLNRLRLSPAKKNYETLNARLERLKAARIRLKVFHENDKYVYDGHLILEQLRAQDGKNFFRLSRALSVLFEPSRYSTLDLKIRSALSKKPMAAWLHAFYSTHSCMHSNNYRYQLSTIRDLCGSGQADLTEFKKSLIKGLVDLKQAYLNERVNFDFTLENSLLKVIRDPTPKQKNQYAKSRTSTPKL